MSVFLDLNNGQTLWKTDNHFLGGDYSSYTLDQLFHPIVTSEHEGPYLGHLTNIDLVSGRRDNPLPSTFYPLQNHVHIMN